MLRRAFLWLSGYRVRPLLVGGEGWEAFCKRVFGSFSPALTPEGEAHLLSILGRASHYELYRGERPIGGLSLITSRPLRMLDDLEGTFYPAPEPFQAKEQIMECYHAFVVESERRTNAMAALCLEVSHRCLKSDKKFAFFYYDVGNPKLRALYAKFRPVCRHRFQLSNNIRSSEMEALLLDRRFLRWWPLLSLGTLARRSARQLYRSLTRDNSYQKIQPSR